MPTFDPKEVNTLITGVLMRFQESADKAAAKESESPAEMASIKAFISDALAVTDVMAGLVVKAVHALERIADAQENMVQLAAADLSDEIARMKIEAEETAKAAVNDEIKRKPLGW